MVLVIIPLEHMQLASLMSNMIELKLIMLFLVFSLQVLNLDQCCDLYAFLAKDKAL